MLLLLLRRHSDKDHTPFLAKDDLCPSATEMLAQPFPPEWQQVVDLLFTFTATFLRSDESFDTGSLLFNPLSWPQGAARQGHHYCQVCKSLLSWAIDPDTFHLEEDGSNGFSSITLRLNPPKYRIVAWCWALAQKCVPGANSGGPNVREVVLYRNRPSTITRGCDGCNPVKRLIKSWLRHLSV